ncbi:BLUF domain-containing protein [Phreatobacter oligotrophus]|jgi:hypothetical protein|uniref:FAD-dependent sensor of blue light n=1 Tax=Phreatobacter oligotrophus TaxID=1122261 RepID=A0A2T4YS33_9HYPH|nr:BLUF domain-containing protein [Phreatobacter oligotrophus]PTM46463.1 FAD-dependent sensor of blue light [Phreatobacter oligotrophus]
MLYRCIYASKLSDAIDEHATFDTLTQIEGQSARNNARLKLTGILLSVDRHFLQVLEGSNRSISTLLGKLFTDQRHSDILLVELVPVDRRLFPEWTMKWAPLKRRPDFVASGWTPENLKAPAILSLAKSIRAGVNPTSRMGAAHVAPDGIYLD